MMLLIWAFVGILLLTFGVVAFITRPTPEQKSLDRRIAFIKSSATQSDGSGDRTNQLLKDPNVSKYGWIEELLERYPRYHKYQMFILQADSKATVAGVLISSVALAGAGALVCQFFIPILIVQLAIGAALGAIPVGILSFKRSRRIAAFNATLPDAIDMLGRALRSGHSMVSAIGIIAEEASEPARTEFAEVFKKQNYGLPLRDALMQMLDRVPSQDLRVLVTGILVQKDTGGNLAEILDRTVFVIRERLRIQGEIRTHTAQGRMTGWILCSLPIVMLLLINMVNPGYSKVLMDTPIGHKLIYVGMTLLAIGGFLIRQIVNGIEV